MANKYGRGYYTNWESMELAIEIGITQAFKEACEQICEQANDMIRGGIYGNLHSGQYDDFRTYEMADIEYLKANVSGTYCNFEFNNKEFMTLTIDNPEHHGLSDDKGNGYSANSFMWELINPNHGKFMDDVRDYIQKEFAKVYRECCRRNGLTLQ